MTGVAVVPVSTGRPARRLRGTLPRAVAPGLLRPRGRGRLRPREAVHAILRAAGFSDLDAVRTFYTLLSYVFGFIAWELPRVHQQPAAAYTAAWNDALDRLDPSAYPNLHALRPQLTTVASPEQFEYGLRHLVRSLRAHD